MPYIINTIVLLQYFLLNGLLIHHFFISRGRRSSIIAKIVHGIIISTSLNSITLYLLAVALKMPITPSTVIIMSLSLSLLIIIFNFLKNYSAKYSPTAQC